MQKEHFNQKLTIFIDILALCFTLFIASYLLITLPNDKKIFAGLVLLIIISYTVINIKFIPKRIEKNNINKEMEAINNIENFLNLTKEDLDQKGITNLYDYLIELQKNMQYIYTLPNNYGFKSELRFPRNANNYALISNHLQYFNIKATPFAFFKEDKIVKIILLQKDFDIEIYVNEIKSKQDNIYLSKEKTEEILKAYK